MKTDARTVQPGDEFDPLTFTVTEEMNDQYLYAEQDHHPRYRWLAHPGLLLNMSNNTRSPSFYLPPGWAEIHARESLSFLRPANVGDELTVTWKVLQTWEKNEMPWHKVSITVTREKDDKIVLVRLMTNTFTRGEDA